MAGRLPHVSMRGTLSRFNSRITLVQFLANAIVIGLLILLLPGVKLHATHEVLAVLWLAAVFGAVTALARPALEFVFLPYVVLKVRLGVRSIGRSRCSADRPSDGAALTPFLSLSIRALDAVSCGTLAQAMVQ